MSKSRTTVAYASSFDNAVNKYLTSQTLADHPELIEEIFTSRGLGEYLINFLEMHKSINENAYHAIDHALMVSLNCFEGAHFSGSTTSEIRILLVAGLFHDARHTQGFEDDKRNIALACAALKAVHSFVPTHHQLNEKELDAAIEAIKYTEYPYKVKTPKTDCGRILRDADMMTVYCANKEKLLRMMSGLLRETNHSRSVVDYTYRRRISVTEFTEHQLNFSSTVTWNTHWAKTKAIKRNWPQVNKNLCALMLSEVRL